MSHVVSLLLFGNPGLRRFQVLGASMGTHGLKYPATGPSLLPTPQVSDEVPSAAGRGAGGEQDDTQQHRHCPGAQPAVAP